MARRIKRQQGLSGLEGVLKKKKPLRLLSIKNGKLIQGQKDQRTVIWINVNKPGVTATGRVAPYPLRPVTVYIYPIVGGINKFV